MSLIKNLVPGFIASRYFDLKKRLDKLETSVRCLEMAIDAMVVTPKYVPGEKIGFNGQHFRKRIFRELISAISFDAFVETGTWLGNTTGYMAQTGGRPVYSCEINPRFQALARMRLTGIEGVEFRLSDSRQFLQELSQGNLTKKCVFFYLDAHWYEDLPLAREIELIATHWQKFVVMIDDFKVPDDPGYTYDRYQDGVTIDLNLLEPLLRKHQLSTFFPSAPASEDTQVPSGCVVLAPAGDLTQKLSGLGSLRKWPAANASD
jgi:hypothetical protein